MDFVPFEISKKLKEKGFKEECLAYYTKDSGFYYNTSYGSDIENAFKSFNSRPNHICGKRIDAPTISQAMKWLRDEKKLFVYPETVHLPEDERLGEHSGKRMWNFSVDDLNIDDCIFESRSKYHSYEEAAMDGIEYVLDNLI